MAYSGCDVTVRFVDNLSASEALSFIGRLRHPQIILWYIGCNGLRTRCVEFYRRAFITPVLAKRDLHPTFWLVDLTAWSAFKSARGAIQKTNSCMRVIQACEDSRIQGLSSAEIFGVLQNTVEQNIVEYFRKTIQRDIIKGVSKNFPDVNVRVKEIFQESCPLGIDWYDCDVSKAYGAFQYLEGCFIIKEIVKRLSHRQFDNFVEIVFVLPNDESKYYKDHQDSFQKDVKFLLDEYARQLGLVSVSLNVFFICFKYGLKNQDRPYNAPGKVLKSRSFSYEDIAGCVTEECDLQEVGCAGSL